ncbi:MAG: type II toxin-antitoxin system Phd/YefM family antitoxin [Chloroflexota bacterium]
MKNQPISSERARTKFYETLDTVQMGSHVVIERQNKPVVVLVNYDEWRRLKSSDADRVNKASAEVKAGSYYTIDDDLGWDCLIVHENHEPVRVELSYERFQEMKSKISMLEQNPELQTETPDAVMSHSEFLAERDKQEGLPWEEAKEKIVARIKHVKETVEPQTAEELLHEIDSISSNFSEQQVGIYWSPISGPHVKIEDLANMWRKNDTQTETV